jgi:hypothetical protein
MHFTVLDGQVDAIGSGEAAEALHEPGHFEQAHEAPRFCSRFTMYP